MINEPLRITGPEQKILKKFRRNTLLISAWPTNRGIMTTQEMARATGRNVGTIRGRIADYGWQSPLIFTKGKLSRGSGFSNNLHGRRSPESIPVGTWERQYLGGR